MMLSSRRSRIKLSRNQLATLGLLIISLCCFVAAEASPIQTSPLLRQLQNTDNEADEGVIDEKDEAAVMEDDNLEQEYQFDDTSLMEDHFDSKDFPDKATFNVPDDAPDDMMYALGGGGDMGTDKGDKVPDVVYDDFGMDLGPPKDLPKDYDDTPVNPQPEPVEKVPEVVYDDFDAIAPGDPKKPYDDTPVNPQPELPEGEVESDAANGNGMTEEVDVEEKAKELLQEAEEEEEEDMAEDTTLSSSTKAVPLKTYSADAQKKWVAHGAIGVTIFGLLVPSAISSAFFRDLIPGYWIYIHVILNVTTFAMTFFTVGIAFATMNGMGDASEGHMKEVHHIVGLLLLLLVSFQTANGFLRPPREFITDDLTDHTPGAIHRSQTKSLTTRTLWYLSHAGCGLLIFALGTYQVHSGMGLFSKRFGTTDWGSVYLGYIFLVITVVIGGKSWVKLRERKSKRLSFEMQMGGEGFNYGDDNSSDTMSFRPV
mmetsp:Transcript_28988/g.44778  ORF Transcript_28988/g.44778 Transcript_28988/m.44778 type:complete len:483 (+) Transcript_28988:73-1521(+)